MEIAKGYIEVDVPDKCVDCTFLFSGANKWECCIISSSVQGAGVVDDICGDRPDWCPIRPKVQKNILHNRVCK